MGAGVLGKGSRGEHGASQPLTTPAALLTAASSLCRLAAGPPVAAGPPAGCSIDLSPKARRPLSRADKSTQCFSHVSCSHIKSCQTPGCHHALYWQRLMPRHAGWGGPGPTRPRRSSPSMSCVLAGASGISDCLLSPLDLSHESVGHLTACPLSTKGHAQSTARGQERSCWS